MNTGGLFISAGDPSGDNATSRLILELRESQPSLFLSGLGGPRLKKLGQVQLANARDLAVLGFGEVARRYFFFRQLMLRCVEQIRQQRPKCILLVDYPGFNLRLAKRIHALGIPIVYYISPQIWAWHKNRIHQIKALVDLMMLNLPFEKELYDRHGVANEQVGHYLLEDIPSDYIATNPPGSRLLALLPGSRPQEIDRMLVPMLQSARLHNQKFGTRAVVVGLEGAYDYGPVMEPYHADGITLSFQNSRKLIFESDLVLTASGTATLETGIIGRPMVIIYKTGMITFQIARRVITLDAIGLVNLVLGEPTVPELIQHDAVPPKITSALARYEEDSAYRKRIIDRLHTVPDLLGRGQASQRAAALVGRYL
jgi:lipid-A-disaccharide synthase